MKLYFRNTKTGISETTLTNETIHGNILTSHYMKIKAQSMDSNIFIKQPETAKNKREISFNQANNTLNTANKTVQNLSYAKGGANAANLPIQSGFCGPVDKVLQNFAQTINTVKSVNSKTAKGDRNFFESTDVFELKLETISSKVIELIKELSMRSNMKINGCDTYLCLTKDNLRLEFEISSGSAKEHKYLKVQLIKGSKLKASEFLAKTINNIELI